MRTIIPLLFVVLWTVATHAQQATKPDTNTKSLEIAKNVSLVFKKISPKSHDIEYPEFFVLETEVTNRQFKAYLDAKKLTKDDTDVLKIIRKREKSSVMSTMSIPYKIKDESAIWRKGSYPHGLDDHPVTVITLDDATNFAKWVNENHDNIQVRLPTWNEWMITAYGKSRKYPWGDDWDRSKVHSSHGLMHEFSFEKSVNEAPPKRTEPVKTRVTGKTPDGVYGLLGNAGEYLIDSDPSNSDYFNLGSRSMGGGFTDGLVFFENQIKPLKPRNDYWGYSHHKTGRSCDLGFRLVLVTENNDKMLKHEKLFEQRNKAWMTDGTSK